VPLSAARFSPLRNWLAKWRSRSQSRQARSVLEEVRAEISSMSQSTEGVFLLVGGRLGDLAGRARELAEIASSIAELLATDAGSLAVLDEVLQSTLGSTEARDMAAAVAGIQQQAKSIHRVIETVSPVVRTFDMLGVITRIESSRFEGTGVTFVSLADAVGILSRQIREQVAVTADSAAELLETINRASEQIRRVARQHEESLKPLSNQTSAELEKIREHRGQVGQATQLLGERMREVSQAVGDVVTHLQSHDIVRQQIEHVVEALARAESNEAEVARLQAAQLENSHATLENSARQIQHALSRIEHDIAEIAEDAARLIGLSEKNDATFFATLEKGLARILDILESNVTADAHVTNAAVAVEERAAEMGQTNAGVHSIGIEMQRIALNSTIQAAQLGSDGGALETAARAIQGLARETERASDTLSGTLETVRTAAAALAQSTAAGSKSGAQIVRLRESSRALGSIQDKAREDCKMALDMSAELNERIRETIEGFGSQAEILETLRRAVERLRGLSPDTHSGDSADMKSMLSLYTMESERAVHDVVYESGQQSENEMAAGTPDKSEEENVEFF